MAEIGWRPKLRVLCLHGRCQTAATFETKLDKLAGKAASFAELVFVDGPLELPLQHGERVNTRGWWGEGGADDVAVQKVLARAWAEHGPFDGVLGFSEGASAAVTFCRLAAAAEAAGPGAADATGTGLRFALLFGAPAPRHAKKEPALKLPSLHFASPGDTVVPIADSRRLAKEAFEDPLFLEHDGGHGVPQRAEDVRRVANFLQERRDELYRPGASATQVSEEDPRVGADQRDELEALAAVYPEELVRISPAWPVRLAVRLTSAGSSLRFAFPPAYPQAAPCRCELASEELGLLAHEQDLLAAVEAEQGPPGFPSVLAMFQAAQQWVADHEAELASRSAALAAGSSPVACSAADAEAEGVPVDAWWSQEEGEVDNAQYAEAEKRAAELLPDTSGSSAAWARACGAGNYSRPWEFVVGLVGKPSAGKSTLFNAATRPAPEHQAAMAPHPFTTIDPNVGAGWFAAPCPAESLGVADAAKPEHGVAPGGRRRLPLLVKDVAGLVPGAYMGRGRGNAFLNDLCDADSLVHVVDASGRSDREGVDQGGGGGGSAGAAAGGGPGAPPGGGASDPLDEVGWVRREIHLWIFCNVRAKWDSVRRRARMTTSHAAREALADRLFGLFTGYHASRQLVMQVYEAAGFSLASMAETVYQFREYDLHLLVGCFLRARFPIVVALNKVDMPEAAEPVRRAMEKLGNSCVPVSARSEWWLWEQQRLGHLTYVEGAGADGVTLAPSTPAAVLEQWAKVRSGVLEPYGCTGVQEVFSRAVRQRRPLFVCPVADLATLEPLVRAGSSAAASAAPPPPLATMVILRPLSSVEEAFTALKHEQMLRGDFVRAEVLTDAASRTSRVLKRDETLRGADDGEDRALVLKVLTNKKAK